MAKEGILEKYMQPNSAYEGLSLPSNFDPVETNYKVAAWTGAASKYVRILGWLAVPASYFIGPAIMPEALVALTAAHYLEKVAQEDLVYAQRVEAERDAYLERCRNWEKEQAAKMELRARMEQEISDNISEE